jgi:uncharacterized membrane protein
MKNLLVALSFSIFSTTTFATTVSCAGTEPFWSVRTDGKVLMYSDPVSRTRPLPITSVTQAAGFANGFAFIVKTNSTRLTVIAGECSDGMSDETYSHHTIYEMGDRVLAGCCNVL